MEPFIIIDMDLAVTDLPNLLESSAPQGLWGFKFGDKILRSGTEHMLCPLAKKRNVFVDLKHYDTADRLKRIVGQYAILGDYAPKFLTVSSDVGEEALKAAISARGRIDIIVTGPLSNWTDGHCLEQYGMTAGARAWHVLNLSRDIGAQGMTYPAWLLDDHKEVKKDIAECKDEGFAIVATGIRSKGRPAGNHIHPRTPDFAMKHGASHIVLGDEITGTFSREGLKRLWEIHDRCCAVSA